MTASKLVNTTGETITLKLKTGGSIKINPGQSAIVSIQQVREINKMIKNKRKNLLITNQNTDKDFVNVDDMLNKIPVPENADEITEDEAKELEKSKLTDEEIKDKLPEVIDEVKEDDVKDENTEHQPSLGEDDVKEDDIKENDVKEDDKVKDEDVKSTKKTTKKNTKKKNKE